MCLGISIIVSWSIDPVHLGFIDSEQTAVTSATVPHHLLTGPLDLVVSIGMELPSSISNLSFSRRIVRRSAAR